MTIKNLSYRQSLSHRLQLALLALFAALSVACGGPSFLENARSGVVDLSGHWQLTEKSDTRLATWLNELAKKQEKLWRRDANRMSDGEAVFTDANPATSPDGTPGQFSNHQWMREQSSRDIATLIEWLSPAAELDIKQGSQLLEMRSSKQEGTRRFVATESSSLIQSIGAFSVSSGWVENSYVIRSIGSGDNDLRLIETYTLRAEGRQLVKNIEASVPMLGKKLFTFVYEKNSAKNSERQ